VRIRSSGAGAIEVTAARHEMSALVAGARMALRLMEEDPGAPADARAALARVIASYDAALAAAEPEEPGPGPR
jgi:hypothetical protein